MPDSARIQDAVELAEELPMNRFNPDYYPLEVGNHVLGGGFYATRLYRDLRENTGYVYYVSNELQARRTRSRFIVRYECDSANVSKAHALVVRDLRQMQVTDVSPAELRQAKALLLRQIPLAEAKRVTGGQRFAPTRRKWDCHSMSRSVQQKFMYRSLRIRCAQLSPSGSGPMSSFRWSVGQSQSNALLLALVSKPELRAPSMQRS